ncbi:MAG: hypothetical protein CL855_01785 [Cryomorphaceae bacterium]|mgnify:FL=1|nr:hypothetical protein [Cryomorphaceae bacterium]|tara:strand:- start:366 stop:1046 length:681 start_codon:yes stop_codon:yes gene_type:complete
MELSSFTMQTLKNFSSINPNLVINPGKSVMTMSEAKNILAQATVPEEFDRTFGIYDLSEFLSVVNLFDAANLKLDDQFATIGDTSGRAKIKYFFSDTEMLTSPSKPIVMPDPEVTFTLDQTTLANLKRAASALGHSEVSITGSNGVVTLTVVDTSNSTSNTYSIDVDGEYKSEDFNFILNISNLRMIASDYKVEISSKLISQFTSTSDDMDLKYWVALEKSSTYKD